MKTFFAAGAVAVGLAGSVAASPVSYTLDAFVVYHNQIDGLSESSISTYVDASNAAGTLTLSYDTDDVMGGFLLLGDVLNVNPSSLALRLSFGGITQSWTEADFVLAPPAVTTDLDDPAKVTGLEFAVLPPFTVDANITDITPVRDSFGPILRFDGQNNLTGINLEVQSTVPISIPAPIPVPASLPLLAGGMVLLGAFRRKTSKKS